MQIPNTTVRPLGGPQGEQGMLHASLKRPCAAGGAEGVCAKSQHSMQACSTRLQNIRCIAAAARAAMEGERDLPQILAS